ncbi:hypothetical protein P7K49_020030, partial [Saguinus oedipus]
MFPDPDSSGSQGRACADPGKRRGPPEPPPGAQGPARLDPPGSFILHPRLLHLRAP